jgi:TolB-like protein
VRATPPSRLAQLVAELRRRRVFRALLGYGIFSFAVLQVAEPVLHGLGLGDAWLRGLLIALGTGFPVTALASWTFDLTRRGVRRTEAAPDAPVGRAAWARGAALLGSAALGAALATGAWLGVAQRQGSGEAARPAGQPVTLAILPFSNLSGDASQEYFSDGMTEEITGKLSRLRGLSVTAGSSVAKYRGVAKGAREIGKELGVAYLLEGSVRRAGDRIRVSANLVKTADGVQAWAESMDARLDDIFEVQDRVASRIAEALRLRLSAEEAHALRDWGTRDVAAYDEIGRAHV